jgi:uncharacterized protein (DUF1330 family)
MPRGYWIARLDVLDSEIYKDYVKANAEAFAKYGAKFLTRGGPYHVLEGFARTRNVILEFESVEQALACYNSPEYQAAYEMRKAIAVSDIVIMAGYDGPQPPEQPGELAQVDVVSEWRKIKREAARQQQGLS